jgi:CRISPR-associated endonuclease Csn1
MRYRLGLDVGTGSLGWAVLEIDDDDDPFRIERMGSRIFGTGRQPKDNTTLAGNRTAARAARRRRDRYIQRRNHTMQVLVDAGLMPQDRSERKELQTLNPFRLRYEAIRQELPSHHVGRALFHLQQRRGFKSNRKADKGDSDTGAMKTAIAEFQREIANDDTVGSHLWQRIDHGGSARARHRGDGAKLEYDFYVERSMIEDEFDRIWDHQEQFHAALMDASSKERVRQAIFHQRPLKPVDPGKCFLEKDQPRAPKALPSSQRFRMLQEVNSLRARNLNDRGINARPLTRDERDKALSVLHSYQSVKFGTLRNKVFGKASPMTFSLEEGERAQMGGDVIGTSMRKAEAFGDRWDQFDLGTQDNIVGRIIEIESEDESASLAVQMAEEFDVSTEQAAYVVDKVRTPEGHMRLSTKAINTLIPLLQDGWDNEADKPLTYSQAAGRAGYEFSQWHPGEVFYQLPYYGQVLPRYVADVPRREDPVVRGNTDPDEWMYGRIANPTVHIGLNQIRKVVNALIAEYGKPAAVHIEVARELGQSKDARAEASRRRNDNEKRNDRLREELQRRGEVNNYANREKLRLYEELGPLNHACVICGRPIELARLFFNDYQVDHNLPFSKTLDDSFANKILIHAQCNRVKGNRTPFEAFGSDAERWEGILARAESLPGNKLKRFAEDAMKQYEEDGDFIARQLTDTAYLARVTRQYLGGLYADSNDVQRRMIVTPGRLTGLLRGKWGLNSLLGDTGKKIRADHRHHAIDAVVIAVTDRRMLKAVTDANVRAKQEGVDRLLQDMPLPWDDFRNEVREAVDRIVVSHRPDHGIGGQLHEKSAYSVKEGPDKDGRFLSRKRGKDGDWEEYKWRPLVPVYRAGESKDSALPYKGYIGGSNHCIEIVRMSNGRWSGEVISRFEANQPSYREFMRDRKRYLNTSYSGIPLVMRLVATDTIMIEDEEGPHVLRFYKVFSSGQMFFTGVNESDVDSRYKAGELKVLMKNANPLRSLMARRVFVDVLGNVKDPGFSE